MDKQKTVPANGSNINRLVYVQQQQHKALESMGVLLNTAAETLKTPFPHTSSGKRK